MGASVFARIEPIVRARREKGLDVIELHIGDTCREPSRTARYSVLATRPDPLGRYRYGSVLGRRDLRHACLGWLEAHGVGANVDPDRHVLIGAGATHAISCVARVLFEVGNEVLLIAPYWPLAVGILRTTGASPVEVPLTQEIFENPSLDVRAVLESYRTPRTRGIYVISPNNPDGKVWSTASLEKLAEFAIAHDLWVISDEAYLDFVFEGVHVSARTLEGMRERTVAAYSFSKSLGLAGARVGFCIGPEEVIAAARRVSTHTVFNVPELEQELVCEALETHEEWAREARIAYRALCATTCRALDRAGLTYFAPEGGAYVFVQIAEKGRADEAVRRLTQAAERGVVLAPGDGFGDAFGHMARLCFTSETEERTIEGIARLQTPMSS